jgi:hypothetical protein
MCQVLTLKRDEVKFIDCTVCDIKKLKTIYTLLFKDWVIMLGKIVQRLFEPGASFFGDREMDRMLKRRLTLAVIVKNRHA